MALVLSTTMGSGVTWGVLKLRDPNVLPVKVVRIDGDFRHLKRIDLEHAVGNRVTGNFFTIDVDAVREAALRLPWVDQVSVRRVWPDTLMMWVEEQEPLARWGEDRLVNLRGEVFAPAAGSIPAGLPGLSGPEGSSIDVVRRYREMMETVTPLGLEIESLKMDQRNSWMLQFRRGLELQLGSVDAEKRLQRFAAVYGWLKVKPGSSVKRIDMRYTNGLAVYRDSVEQGSDTEVMKPASGVKTKHGKTAGRGQV
ncbi:cell division protein FtsQ/DivIB [Solemya velesiana gill symbiont]|nr:cell division protein FtsQ/DivIB [Solemya velesiana gill symbiont]